MRRSTKAPAACAAHDIVLQADAALPAHAVPSELHSAFFNLIANAIRYSPDPIVA